MQILCLSWISIRVDFNIANLWAGQLDRKQRQSDNTIYTLQSDNYSTATSVIPVYTQSASFKFHKNRIRYLLTCSKFVFIMQCIVIQKIPRCLFLWFSKFIFVPVIYLFTNVSNIRWGYPSKNPFMQILLASMTFTNNFDKHKHH